MTTKTEAILKKYVSLPRERAVPLRALLCQRSRKENKAGIDSVSGIYKRRYGNHNSDVVQSALY